MLLSPFFASNARIVLITICFGFTRKRMGKIIAKGLQHDVSVEVDYKDFLSRRDEQDGTRGKSIIMTSIHTSTSKL